MTSKEQETKTAVRRTLSGVVRSISGEKTINVDVSTLVKHEQYGKYVRRRTKLAVHDPAGDAGVGDRVEIVPCRRISKHKSWRLARIVRRNTAVTIGKSK